MLMRRFCHFAKLLLLRLDVWVDVQAMLNDVSTDSPKVAGGPCKNILILAEELEKFFLLFGL